MRLVARAMVVAGCLIASAACNPPPAPETVRTIRPGHMPPGAAQHAGNPDLTLRVTLDDVSGAPTGFEPGSAESTDLVVGFVPDATATVTTTLRLTNRSKRPLKVDLWVSEDGQRYVYSSSCPIAAGKASFETWEGRLPWVFVSNPRFVGPDAHSACE
jgi:hypothetical protein